MKKNRKKIFLVMLLCSFCAANIPTITYASEKMEVDTPQPYLTILRTVTIKLTDNDGIASISGYVSAATDADKTSIQYELEKYTGGTWKSVTSWSESIHDSLLSISSSYIVGSGKYRVKGTAYAYRGTKKDSLVVTSNTVTF